MGVDTWREEGQRGRHWGDEEWGSVFSTVSGTGTGAELKSLSYGKNTHKI